MGAWDGEEGRGAQKEREKSLEQLNMNEALLLMKRTKNKKAKHSSSGRFNVSQVGKGHLP
jgi:hypothetical protein